MKRTELIPDNDVHQTKCLDLVSAVDSELRKKVYEMLESECDINTKHIKVMILGRTVFLEGNTGSEKDRNILSEAASDIFGVRNVVNYLTFPSPRTMRTLPIINSSSFSATK